MTLIMCVGTTHYGRLTTNEIDGEFVVEETGTGKIERVPKAKLLKCQHEADISLTMMSGHER